VAAILAPQGQIQLAFCSQCSHVFNPSFDPAVVEYDPEYENSLFFSPLFRQYAAGLAQSLIARYDLHAKDILEIGSGSGDFLRLICDLGGNRGLGFDPSYLPTAADSALKNIHFVPEFFSETHLNFPADLICCRHVLEHLDAPRKFVELLRKFNALAFFEVPNALCTLRDLGIWDVIYEHPSFFTPASLAYLFHSAGFSILQINETFGDQFLTIEAVPLEVNDDTPLSHFQDPGFVAHLVAAFAKKFGQKIHYWKHSLAQSFQRSEKVVLWGAGSKGVTFLNALPTRNQIAYIVDINPRKIGRFVPGTGQQIVPPDFLSTYQPDRLILMNSNYLAEIQDTIAELGITPKIETA